MAEQWIEIFEHDARDTYTGSETMYPLPVMGSLKPKFNPTDEPRKEFRGGDTGQGYSSLRRKESQWSHTIECNAYPSPAVGLLLAHALGHTATRTLVETTARKGMITSVPMPFGGAAELLDKCIGIRINYDNGEGTTVSRIYYGGRVHNVGGSGSGTDEVKYAFDLTGPGDYITAAAAGTTPPDFSDYPEPFNSSDCLLYIGSGISRTGTKPDFTDLDPGTMVAFSPDSFEFKLESGRSDKIVMNGVRGPSFTTKEGEMLVTATFPVDLRDPSSGFSSRDEIDLLHTGVRENSVMIIMDSGEMAGDTSETFRHVWDFPRLYLKAPDEEYNTEGKIPHTTLEYSHLISDDTGYALGVLVVDQSANYGG